MPEPGIGLAGRDRLGHGRMRRLVSAHSRRCAPASSPSRASSSSSSTRVPVPSARLTKRARRRATSARLRRRQRIARRHDQPLRAPREADDLVQPGLEQRLVGALRQRAQRRPLERVEARHHAAALVERADRVDAAGEADVQLQPRAARPHARAAAPARRRGWRAGSARACCRRRRARRRARGRHAAPRSAAPAGPAPGARPTAACRRTPRAAPSGPGRRPPADGPASAPSA